MNGAPPASSISGRPLSGSIGMEVSGVKLGAPLSKAVFSALHEIFLQSNGILVFPEQFLGPAELHAFAVLWGTPVVLPYLAAHSYPGYPDVLRVTNPGKARVSTERWHCDSVFLENPPAITILAAQELPDVGGDTMWANQYLAYERLSAGMQRLLAGVRGCFPGTQPNAETGKNEDVFALHEIVRTHPETGRRSLLVGHPGDSLESLEDLTPAESRPLLEFLYGHATQADLIYRHHWRPGDVVMWDNRCTLHYAVHDYGDAVRNLCRVTLTVD
jgi:taurine dioxygenase